MKVGMLIAGTPWSGNQRKRRHHMAVYRHDADWKHRSWSYAKDIVRRHGVVPADFGVPARVTITFQFRTERRRDIDNWTAACKGILDGLVGVLIVDDDTKHIELVVRTEVDPMGASTKVEVETIGG